MNYSNFLRPRTMPTDGAPNICTAPSALRLEEKTDYGYFPDGIETSQGKEFYMSVAQQFLNQMSSGDRNTARNTYRALHSYAKQAGAEKDLQYSLREAFRKSRCGVC